MNGRKKRGLRVLCALLAAVLLIPGTRAVNTPDAGPAAELQAAASGTCGTNLTWTLNNGVLTISGTGDMTEWVDTVSVPWYGNRESITTVVLPDGLTSIGIFSFRNCSNLARVNIPDSLTWISSYAFCDCGSLKDVAIPDSVTRIEDRAFLGCASLTEITIPGSVTEIGDWAFSDCAGLTSVTIPDSVVNIGDYAFYKCTGLTAVEIPARAVSIGYDAFYGCTGLTELTIPDGASVIGNYVFNWCTGLKSVTIPESVTTIGDGAFNRCTGVTDVYYSGTETQWNQISIGTDNDPLTSAQIHYSGDTIVDSGTCGENLTWTLENGVLTISGTGAMTDWENGESVPWYNRRERITAVVLPDGLTSIGNWAFEECAGLTGVGIPDSVTTIGICAFNKCTGLTEVTIPERMTTIQDWAFNRCTGLTAVTIPDGVTRIEWGVFERCTGLKEVTIPYSVTSVGGYAFFGCTSLADVYYGGTETQWKNISIGTNNDPLTSAAMHYSGGPTIVDSGTCGENLTWTLDENGVLTISGTGAMTNWHNASDVPWYKSRESITALVLPDGLTSIWHFAFDGCSGLRDVDIPDSVTTIGVYAFRGCTGLTEVTIPDGVTNISGGPFANCENLNLITVSEGNQTYISENGVLFDRNDQALMQYPGGKKGAYSIPDSVTRIRSYAFEGCTGLTAVTIPDGLTSIGDSAFNGCTGLTSVTIPDSVTYLGNLAFRECTALTAVTIPESVPDIRGYAFYGCTSLRAVTIPESVTTIDESAFYGCTSLTDVYYNGTEEQWKQISIDDDNDPLKSAAIHYDTEIFHTVTFDPDGGTVTPASRIVSEGKPIGELPVPTRAGYTFAGWFDADGRPVPPETVVTGDMTVTARWETAGGFDAARDAWSFGNTAAAFGYTNPGTGKDYPVPAESLFLIFGKTIRAKSLYKQISKTPWAGNCAGMSGTAALFFDAGVIKPSDFGQPTVSALALDSTYEGMTAKTFIEAMQIAQYTDTFSAVLGENLQNKNTLNGGKTLNPLYQAVSEGVERRQTVLVGVVKAGIGGHALLAFGAERVSGTEARLSVYDCNYPGQTRYVTLTGTGGSLTAWSYDMGGGFGVWGSEGADGGKCSISYVPCETLVQIWENRGKTETNNQVLRVNASNLSIMTYDEEEVARLVDGVLVTDRADVYEMPELSMYWSDERSIYLPKDYYTISTTDDMILEASLTDNDLSASVTTTAGTVSFAVDDAEGENSVLIEDASAEDIYTVVLESSMDGAEEKNVTASGKRKAGGAEVETISISLSTDGNLTLSQNIQLNSLFINGEEWTKMGTASYAVTDARTDGRTLLVSLSNPASCTAAAVFRDEAGRYLTTAACTVEAGSGTVSIPLPDGLPDGYAATVFLLGDGLCPLCGGYAVR